MMSIWAATAVATFNLICVGTQHTDTVFHKKNRSFNYTFRLDLDQGIYCQDDCRTIHAISAVLPTRIRLKDVHVDTAAMTVLDTISIDRGTGEYHGSYTYISTTVRDAMEVTQSTGHCERADFTGFPRIENKF